MADLELSVVIPTLNPGRALAPLLERVAEQESVRIADVVVVDSGSVDRTVAVARDFGARVVEISYGDFDHGSSRDLGISLARGRYVALTVQDALPADRRWLASLAAVLDRDPDVAGAYSRQLAPPGSAPLTRSVAGGLAAARSERVEQTVSDPEAYSGMHPAERRRLAAFDNVSSCVRRSVWEEHPFGPARFGEDIRWGKRVVESGYKLVFEPRSVVHHAHARGAGHDLRRHYVDAALLAELFGLRPVPTLPRLAVAVAGSSARHARALRMDDRMPPLTASTLAVRHALASQLGVYLGGRAAALHARSPGAYRRLDRALGGGI